MTADIGASSTIDTITATTLSVGDNTTVDVKIENMTSGALLLTQVDGTAKVWNGQQLIDAPAGQKYFKLKVTISPTTSTDYSSFSGGTFHLTIGLQAAGTDAADGRVRLSNQLTSDHVGANVTNLYVDFTLSGSAGLSSNVVKQMFVAVTPTYSSTTYNANEIDADLSLAQANWDLNIVQGAGSGTALSDYA